MLRLMGIAISIGLADSLNPSTIAPALYLAAGERPRDTVWKFTLGVFAAYLVGGVLIAIGPGQLLLSLIPTPSRLARQLLEVAVGVVMLAVGSFVWRHRNRLVELDPPAPSEGKSSALLGAGITVVELPTAFPYFFVIAAVVASPLDLLRQFIVLLLFNVCFVLPLLAIILTLWVFGEGASARLALARSFLQSHWPNLLAGVALVAGVFVITLGATGIVARVHGKLGRFFKHVNKILRVKPL